jgi:hypothetical protein
MNKSHSLFAACFGLVIALGAGFGAANMRSAEATSAPAAFARPDFTAPPPKPPGVDLTLFSALADPSALKKLSRDVEICHDALSAASVTFTEVPAKREGQCGYSEALEISSSLATWEPNPGAPKDLPMTCALAAKLHLWERHVVIPAAEKYFGSPVREVKVFGTFQCRNVADTDKLSEHAFAKAIDVAGFVLADGREITVLGDYRSSGAEGDFLREIRQRACDLFDVTLGPDYNAAHENHFHLDVGGQHACR